MMNLSLTAVESAEKLRASEQRHALIFASAFGVCTLVIGFLACIGQLLFPQDLDAYKTFMLVIFGGGAFVVVVVLFLGFLRGNSISGAIMFQWHKWQDAERAVKYPVNETTETTEAEKLPTDPRIIPVTSGERVGEVVAELVNGFDPRTLDWFALYLANGNRTSENALETMPIPYDDTIPPRLFGGASPGTPFTRLMDLCEERGVLSERDKQARKSGKLLILDEKEIKRRLKGADDGNFI